MFFQHKKDKFDPYNVLLAIATNILVLIKTVFVVQGHILLLLFESEYCLHTMQWWLI